jgi:hypothetical protein
MMATLQLVGRSSAPLHRRRWIVWLCLGLVVMSSQTRAQDDRDDDPTRLPGPAHRYYRLGLWDRAEALMREVIAKDPTLNRLFIKYYYAFKQRNGYSDLEIAQKREALENILVPYQAGENVELFLANGFSEVDVFFKWYNFCGLVAIK